MIHHGDGAFCPSLLAGLRKVCAGFPDARKGRHGNIAIADFGLSAVAPFFMQGASFLAFQRALEKGHGRSNYQTLFGIGKIPSDNYIRDMLGAVDPVLLQPCFERMEQLLGAPPLRQTFARPGDRILIGWDGTECFCSQKLVCPHCLRRKRANGEMESHHTLLVANGGRARLCQGRPAVSRVHRAAGRRRKTGPRTQCRQALARQARRQAAPGASRLFRR